MVPASAASFPTVNEAPQPAPLEASGIGIRLLDIPIDTQNDPRARSYVVDHLRPGTTIERRVQIQNNTDLPQSVRVYPGAARIQDGSFIGEEGASENELTTWTSIDHPQMELAPTESIDTRVTIDVPEDASEGEQYAAVWAEVRSPVDAETNIISASRVGVRIYLSVGPGNGPPTDFSIDSLIPGRTPEGVPVLTSTVTNTGGRALDMSGTLALTDGPGGLSSGSTPMDKGTTIAPGSSGPVRVTLPVELPNGPWQANLEIKSGLVSREAAATVTFPDAGQGQLISPDQGLNPALLVAIGVALLVLVVGLILWWVRRRKVRDQGRQTN